MKNNNNQKAYALPLVLSVLTVATVVLVATLNTSVRNLIDSQLRSRTAIVSTQATEKFNHSKEVFFQILNPMITNSEIGDLSDPNEIAAARILLGELPQTTSGLYEPTPNEPFDPEQHNILEHPDWRRILRSGSNRFDEIFVEVACVGESDATGTFQLGQCTRSNTHFPKIFEMRVSVRDEKDKSIFTSITGELSISPLSLNDFSLVLTDADRVVFGNGSIFGNVSINLGTNSEDALEDVLFLNSGSLDFHGSFSVSHKDQLYFGRTPDISAAPSGYQSPNFAYGIQNAVIGTEALFTNFHNLQNDSSLTVIDISQPNATKFTLGEHETIFSPPVLMGSQLKFGEAGAGCVFEATQTLSVVVNDTQKASQISCQTSTGGGSQQHQGGSGSSGGGAAGGDAHASTLSSAGGYYLPEGTQTSSGNSNCGCGSDGTAFCLRKRTETVVNVHAAGINNETLILNQNDKDTIVTSMVPSDRSAVYCGQAFTYVGTNSRLIFEKSFVQRDLDTTDYKNSRVQASFVTLGDDQNIEVTSQTKTLSSSGPNTLGDIYQGQAPSSGTTFRIDAAVAPLGQNARFGLASELSSLPNDVGHRPFGEIEMNGSLVSEKTPYLRALLANGTTRVGFDEVTRRFIPTNAPGFNFAVSNSLRIAVNNVSVTHFRAEEAFQIAGIENPTTLGY